MTARERRVKKQLQLSQGPMPRAGKEIATIGLLKEGAQVDFNVHSSTTERKGIDHRGEILGNLQLKDPTPTGITRTRQGKVPRGKKDFLASRGVSAKKTDIATIATHLIASSTKWKVHEKETVVRTFMLTRPRSTKKRDRSGGSCHGSTHSNHAK